MSQAFEQLNSKPEAGKAETVPNDDAVTSSDSQADRELQASIEELMKRAGLEPSLENAQAIYALTDVPDYLLQGLDLEGRPAYRFSKRAFDIAASAAGICLLSWLILGTAIAVKLTSPGPIIFKQQRVGKGKQLFNIYKFRTMRIDTPDLPSHMIDANDWLTPIGAFMRRFSLDELPQLWNILKGDMSAVGPRPALWSQFDLVAERDLYGANNVRPGLTGWAQINGRDELSIKTKAMRDGEYVAKRGIGFDLRCFFGTFAKLLTGSGVVESTVPEPEEANRQAVAKAAAVAGTQETTHAAGAAGIPEATRIAEATAQVAEVEHMSSSIPSSVNAQTQESEKGAIA